MNSLKKREQIKVCLDTNVWVSAVIRGGKPAKIIEMAEKGKLMIFISPYRDFVSIGTQHFVPHVAHYR